MQEKTLLRNKKGNMVDWFYVIAFMFLLTVAVFIALYVIVTVQDSGIFVGYTDAENAINITKNTIISFDNLMLFTLIGLSIYILISSALVFNHPAFFIIGFILLCIAVVVSAIMSNTYDVLVTSPQMNATASYFPKTTFVMTNLPLYIAFMFFATLTVMYVSYSKQD